MTVSSLATATQLDIKIVNVLQGGLSMSDLHTVRINIDDVQICINNYSLTQAAKLLMKFYTFILFYTSLP